MSFFLQPSHAISNLFSSMPFVAPDSQTSLQCRASAGSSWSGTLRRIQPIRSIVAAAWAAKASSAVLAVSWPIETWFVGVVVLEEELDMLSRVGSFDMAGTDFRRSYGVQWATLDFQHAPPKLLPERRTTSILLHTKQSAA